MGHRASIPSLLRHDTLDVIDGPMTIFAGQIPARTLGLMLAWRHGIVLFHDIHPKVRTALPAILDATAGSGIQWQDCRRF